MVTMSIDKIISYISSFGTFISALAALYAIWLTIFQRRITYKPVLVMNNFNFEISAEDCRDFQFKIVKGNVPFYTSFSNIGLGTAVSPRYYWDFNYMQAAKKYSELFSELIGNENNSFSVDYQYGMVSIKNKGNNHTYNMYSKPKDTKFLLPYNTNKDTENVIIPLPSLVLLSNIVQLSFLLNLSEKFAFPGPSLTIEYQDIEGNKKKTSWTTELQIQQVTIDDNSISADVSLSFKLDSQTWVSLRLERIRQRYAKYKEKLKSF